MAKDELAVAAVQLCSQADVAQNLERCRELCRRAKARGAEVVLLPENFAFFGPEADKRRLAEPLEGGTIVSALREMARENAVTVIGGGFPELSADPARPHNTLVVVAPDGSLVASYRKLHLFDVELGGGGSYSESAATSPGSAVVVVDVAGFKLGLSICYDLRFPELYRRLAFAGARILMVPSAFTFPTGEAHWEPLIRARAIENQAYVIAPAQFGPNIYGYSDYGNSMIVDPWGRVLARAADQEGVVVAPIDLEYQDRVRSELPALKHARLR